MRLDENERGNTTRLMKVKDMMLKETREQAQRGKRAVWPPVPTGFAGQMIKRHPELLSGCRFHLAAAPSSLKILD